MKIAFLSRYQNIMDRGAETFVFEISERLSNNHEVKVFSGSDADSLSKVLSFKPQVVIPINGRMQSLKISVGRLLGGCKMLITGHSGRGWDDILNILVKPDVFVALTDDLTKWAKKYAWGSRVVKIPNGIDLEKFTPFGEAIKISLPKPIILSVGALVWYKHHERVIEAVSRLNKGSVLIIGEGPLKEDLQKKGEKLLPDRFKISSYSYEEMPKVYRSCDLFTLPSWDREAFGIVYLEAMASGLGIVAPDDSDRSEIIGEAGILTDVSNPQKYAQAIDKALNMNWGEKALNQAKKFSWEKIAKQYEEAFEGLL
ncbi:MAG: Glycosyl transferase, group 1 [Microgenomates group bacterium Gr01-1014_7]|nr:MAG: Glycosyl transferase, group 1 [Microgenomates group bacterium Gr01-1014_7]